MTEGRCAAFAFSFLLHGIIVAAVLVVPFFDAKKEGPIAVNLNFLTMDGNDPAGSGARPKGPIRAGKKENISRSRIPDIARDNELITSREPGAKNEAIHIDNGSHGPVGQSGNSAAHRNVSSASSGTGPGDMKALNYSRPGGADERHFSFIRETIMQGIAYPERARRMGWEGKVVLSFIVRENGSIDDVKVVTSSGFPVLDENARETIARTSFRKKVPVRLYVLLPVEYKLR
jgi:TonB family protein